MDNRVVVFAAHPDDEVLGCGGTIARHIQEGDEVHVMILAEGVTSRDRHRNREKRAEDLGDIVAAAMTANQVLGTTSLVLNDLPDNRMDSLDRLDIIKTVETFMQQHRPSVVYTHHSGDLNVDHRRIHEAVVTACRPVPNSIVKTLLFFEVASSTEWQVASSAPAFCPNWYVDVSDQLTQKLEALRTYQSEMRPWPHARSVDSLEHLARWRGATIGVHAAEAFMLGRHIQFQEVI